MGTNSKVLAVTSALLILLGVVGLTIWFVVGQDTEDSTTTSSNSQQNISVETRTKEAYEILTGSGKSKLQELSDKGYITAAFFAKEQSSANELMLCGPYDSNVAYSYGTAKTGSTTIDLPVTIKFSDGAEKTAVTQWVQESGTWRINEVTCPATGV